MCSYGSRKKTFIYTKLNYIFYDGTLCVYCAVKCACSLHQGVYLDTGITVRVLNLVIVWTEVCVTPLPLCPGKEPTYSRTGPHTQSERFGGEKNCFLSRDSKPGSFTTPYENNLKINSGSIFIVSYLITLE